MKVDNRKDVKMEYIYIIYVSQGMSRRVWGEF